MRLYNICVYIYCYNYTCIQYVYVCVRIHILYKQSFILEKRTGNRD